jgi:hypothetical protein
MIGLANYFCPGPVSKAYGAVHNHACKRLRQWLGAKHKGQATSIPAVFACIPARRAGPRKPYHTDQ